jgi:hypothetical protein
MLLWLFVSGAQGGGIVLGLILALILVGPLAGAGWYVLSRQSAETAAAAALAEKRQVLDRDRLFRDDIGETLRSLADRSPTRGSELRAIADEVQGARHRGIAWEEHVQLDASGLERLERYDDLVRQRVRQLRDAPQDQVSDTSIRELRQALDQREDLLVLGRRAPALDPGLLLRSGTRSTDSVELEQLALGDAVSSSLDNVDYVVENVASYFAEGQTWKLLRLVPTGGETQPLWLYVGPGGLDVAALNELSERPGETDGDAAASPPPLAGTQWAPAGSGTAVVDITGSSGTARGVLVTYQRYRDAQHLGLVERWPDGERHTYAGRLIQRGDLQVWPSVARSAANPS